MTKSTYSYSYNSVTKSILIQRDRELIGVVEEDRTYKSGTDVYGRCPELTPEDIAEILLYTDVQKFLKRLRKAYRGKLRYFVAGEYGEQTARPHYHMILYGWQPTDLEHLYKIQYNGYRDWETYGAWGKSK